MREVAEHCAAHAAVHELDKTPVSLLHEHPIHAKLADLVHDHGDAPGLPAGEEGVQHGRLPSAKEPGEESHRDALVQRYAPVASPSG